MKPRSNPEPTQHCQHATESREAFGVRGIPALWRCLNQKAREYRALQTLHAACLLSLLFAACSPSSNQKQPQQKTAQPPAASPVTVAVAQQKDIPVVLRAIGTVRPFSTVSVRPRVDGQLGKISLTEGYKVKKDELIFTIDPIAFEVGLQQAEAVLARDTASLQIAEADMRRTDELANTKAVAATVIEQNRAKVASLKGTVAADEAAVHIAKVQLSFCYIHAPIDGRVSLAVMNEGNVIKNNDTVLAVINQLQPIYMDFAVPEQNLATIRDHLALGPLKVTATLPGKPAKQAVGDLRVINNQVDSTTGTILLRSVFKNEDETLWPGQFVDVTVTLDVERNVVVVPAEAIQFSQQGKYVAVVKPDQTVDFRVVEVGDSLAQETIVRKGIQANEQVVTSGQLRLQPGSKVEVKNTENVKKPEAEKAVTQTK